jgi:hypothetical protein
MGITKIRAGFQIHPDSVSSLIIKDVSITAADIAPGSLNGTLIANGSVSAVKIGGIPSLPVYANNAAAAAGGLSVGSFYRTGGDPDLVAVVH